LRLDADLPGLDRPRRPAHRRPARRGRDARARRARARRPLRGDRGRRRRARGGGRARRLLDARPAPAPPRRGGGHVRVLVVSGLWPPDVGGPASHAPEVAAFLHGRGHAVEAVVTAEGPPAPEAYPVHWVSRRLPVGARHAAALLAVARCASRSDVVYATGMLGRAALGARLAGRPLVVKLTADPAFERARRLGLWRGSLEGFQRDRSLRTLPLRAERDRDVGQAAHLVAPSAYLRDLALGWGVAPVPQLRPRDELRRALAIDGPALAFAGRLTAQKSLDVGIEAARRAGVELLVAGDGPDRAALERLGHGRFLGALTRQGVLELFRAADAALL